MQTEQHAIQDTERPLVSFIIPCYNTPAEMLQKCVDSVTELSLSVNEREIIIVDDGSEDPAIGDLLLYRDDIIYVRKKNGGTSTARNMGIRMATGKYLQFIDSDDYLSQKAYEHCLDVVRYMKPDMVMFNFARQETVKEEFEEYEDSDFFDGSTYMANNNLKIVPVGYVFDRDILGSLRFPENIYCEDEQFTPQLMLHADRIIKTDAVAYIYRKRDNSKSRNRNVRVKLRNLNDLEQVLYNLQDLSQTLKMVEKRALERRVAQLTMDYIYNIIVHTRSENQLNRRIIRLKKRNLFPLPERNYTKKYKWFRKMANTSIGRKMLMKTLPYIQRDL